MKTKVFSITMALVLALSLCLTMAVPVGADAPVHLVATGAAGNEARVVVGLPSGTILDDIDSISWEEYLNNGYPPHVDIILDTDDNGIADEALVVEYAHNTDAHYYEGRDGHTNPYDAQAGGYYDTFDDDGNGISEITDTAFAWLNSGFPGPYPPGSRTNDPYSGASPWPTSPLAYPLAEVSYESENPGEGSHVPFVGGSLGDWKDGNIVNGIDKDTKVLRLEVEVDNWIVDTDAYVKNIKVNGALNNAVSLAATVPDIVAISVDPTTIDFGTLLPGGPYSATKYIDVENVGTHTVKVDAAVSGTTGDLFFDNLEMTNNDGWTKTGSWPGIIASLTMGSTDDVQAKIKVPATYTPSGTKTAILTFTATGI